MDDKTKKVTVGPSLGFDQGSAYDAMNSQSDGKDKTGSGTYGEGGKGMESENMEGEKDFWGRKI